MRFPYPKFVVCAAAIGATALAMTGCANPGQDFDDFQSRMGTLIDGGTDTGSVDTGTDGDIFAEAGVASFSGDYFSACLEGAYAGDLEKAIYDVFHLEFVQAADGSVSVSGTRYALKYQATSITDKVGDQVVLPSSPVASGGAFNTKVANFITPASANVFGMDLVVEGGEYKMLMQTPTTGCGHFIGKVTLPIPQDVDETCVLRRANPDGTFTLLTNAADLHCP